MKRTLALLLALTMIFALCACGSTPSASNSSSQEKDSSTDSQQLDELSIEGVSFEASSSEKYNMRVNARNIAIPILEDRNLIVVVVYFHLLDASGNGVPANISFIESWSEFPHLGPGQSCWTTSSHMIDKAAVDAAETVEFTACEFRYSQNSQGEWKQIKRTLSKPVSFRIADILPVGEDPFTVENVSIEFMDSLPGAITNQQAWRAGLLQEFDYVLNDSETYAAIRFSITNMTKKDIILNDLSGDFTIELNFDDGFIYSTDGSKPSFLKSGNKFAVLYNQSQNQSHRIGDEITLPPLVTYDVELYLPCAKAVATQTDKPLVLSIHTALPGYNPINVNVR